MANYYESARTNYFLVKDIEEFKGVADTIIGVELVSRPDDEGNTLVALIGDGEYWPTYLENEDGEEIEIEWEEIFKTHLADDQVAIIMGSGAEKLRYISGWALAFNNKGESKFISLDNIYDLAKELGSKITTATY
jgi:hypothetical protein